jgi:hypothetical protein
MKIYKIAKPLPLDEIPVYRGEGRVNDLLSNKEVEFLTRNYSVFLGVHQ